MLQRSAVMCALLLAILVGCETPGRSQSSRTETSHLRGLLRFQMRALSQGRTPTSEGNFKLFIRSIDPALLERTLERAGAGSVDELFISERDGLPYVIFYGQKPPGVAPDLIAYEQVGVDGKRYVGYRLGIVDEVDEQRFAELVPEAANPEK